MKRVEYDVVAPTFDKRYAGQNYDETTTAVRRFIGTASHRAVLEVGCGTGHWLDVVQGDAALLVGIDRSLGMLRRAQKAESRAFLVQGTAELLPLTARLFDRCCASTRCTISRIRRASSASAAACSGRAGRF